MKTLRVETQSPYEVSIGRGALASLGAGIAARHGACAVMLVADDTVDALYGDAAADSLAKAGMRVTRFAFPHGEESKSLSTLSALLRALAAAGLTRSDLIVALGGGVTGDLAGFAAAVYLRGIGYVQAPTTFLAAVDSSVGGKTAVDLPEGKNLAGAFWQPEWVLCDPDTFHTLTPEAFACGVAEAIKYGVLCDEALFALLAQGVTPKSTELEDVVAQCVAIKARIVGADERDEGERQLLNLGHTLGHAVERESGYRIGHGQAVGIGMAAIARAAEAASLCAGGTAARISAALAANGLPSECPFPLHALLPAMLADKKRRSDSITLVLPKRIGAAALHTVPFAQLGAFLSKGREG